MDFKTLPKLCYVLELSSKTKGKRNFLKSLTLSCNAIWTHNPFEALWFADTRTAHTMQRICGLDFRFSKVTTVINADKVQKKMLIYQRKND